MKKVFWLLRFARLKMMNIDVAAAGLGAFFFGGTRQGETPPFSWPVKERMEFENED